MALEIIGRIGAKIYAMAVDSEGRASVFAHAESEDRHINQISGKMWSANYEAVLANAGVYALYLKNTGSVHIHITDVRNHARDAATEIHIEGVTGTVGGGTAITDIASRNIGNSVTPTMTFEDADAATGLTGLTANGTIFKTGSLDNQTSHLRTTSNIIVGPGAAVAWKIITANATNGISGTLSIVEVEHEA